MKIRRVTVEILREGPRHNQLLSPLTPYLAICGDAPAARLTLPPDYEQASFERRLSELRYEVVADDMERLHGVLRDTGVGIGGILGGIPGLAGALRDDGDGQTLVHLRLILSASELARIPFELSKVPVGSDASPDEWLLLHRPICLTRRNRSVPAARRPWTRSPRILLVAGPDVDDACDQHVEAFHRVLAPWSTAPLERGPDTPSKPWLTVVRNTTLGALEAAMQTRPTFVHVLAHGDDDLVDPNGRFGVRLADTTVSGERLASAMTAVDETGEHRPTVVTMATCDSANEASPISPDASVAFALHSRGVPLVIAAQFPLSIEGSLPFVELVYGGLMSGVHPIESMYRLRLKLHALHSELHHDWAALTVHEALPEGLEAELEEVRYRQSRRAHEAALRRAESPAPDTADDAANAVERAAEVLPTGGSYAIEAIGLRAAGWKRLAEAEFHSGRYEISAQRLRQSLAEYRRGAKALLGSGGEVVNKKVSLHWLLTQLLSTSRVTRGGDGSFTTEERAWWTTALLAAETDRDTQTGYDRAWGHVSLIELWLLHLGDPTLVDPERRAAAERAVDNAKQLVALAGATAEQIGNTCRQIRRYRTWWGSTAYERMGEHGVQVCGDWAAVLDVADRLVEILDGAQWEPEPHPDGR